MLSVKVNGHRIRTIREDRELTTTQVAALLSAELGRTVHQSTVTKLEKGTRQPSAKMFGALCRVLRCQKAELIVSVADPEAKAS